MWLAQWIGFVLLSAWFIYIAGFNLTVVCFPKRWQKPVSVAAIVGGLAGAVAFRFGPIETLRAWWFTPLVVDIGCAPLLLLWLVCLCRRGT